MFCHAYNTYDVHWHWDATNTSDNTALTTNASSQSNNEQTQRKPWSINIKPIKRPMHNALNLWTCNNNNNDQKLHTPPDDFNDKINYRLHTMHDVQRLNSEMLHVELKHSNL